MSCKIILCLLSGSLVCLGFPQHHYNYPNYYPYYGSKINYLKTPFSQPYTAAGRSIPSDSGNLYQLIAKTLPSPAARAPARLVQGYGFLGAIQAVKDQSSPNAAAALAYLKAVASDDICGRSTQVYLDVILKGGSVDEAKSAASRIYIDDYNSGLRAEPGSACGASEFAWKKAEAEGKDPVVYSAIAFMENSPGMKAGNPCAVSGREYVNAILEGASPDKANILAAKGFAVAIKNLAAQGKELRDPACSAATKAFFNALPDKPSPPNAAAMIAFIDKAYSGFSFQYDPVCWRSTEAFLDSYTAGNDEITSTRKAARVFFEEFANGGAEIPADSPCAAATRAYYENIPNPPSPAYKAGMEAFMDKMISSGRREPDPACAISTLAYWDASEGGATETDANLAAGEAFLKASRDGLQIAADSPCAAATRAYSQAIKNLPSPPINAAILAFMDEAILSNMSRPDPVCMAAAEAYINAYKSGSGEAQSNEIAGVAFLDAVAATPDFNPGSPCGASAKAYMANFDLKV